MAERTCVKIANDDFLFRNVGTVRVSPFSCASILVQRQYHALSLQIDVEIWNFIQIYLSSNCFQDTDQLRSRWRDFIAKHFVKVSGIQISQCLTKSYPNVVSLAKEEDSM